MMIKNECNESIKKLITSKQNSTGISESNDLRLYRSTICRFDSVNLGRVSNVVFDYYLKQQVLVEATKYRYYYSIPISVLISAPKGFDMSKASTIKVQIDRDLKDAIISDVIEETISSSSIPVSDNNFIERWMMGNAIYSWTDGSMMGHGIRSSDSNLSKGNYKFRSYMIKIMIEKWFNPDPRGLGSNTYEPIWEVIQSDYQIIPGPVGDYTLTIVSGKGTNRKDSKPDQIENMEDSTIKELEIENELVL